jgi:hypothetical protein
VAVIHCSDTGRNDLSKSFNDSWLAENKFDEAGPLAETVGDLLRSRGDRDLVIVADDATIAFCQDATGEVTGHFNAWLTLRGIKSPALRME